MRDAAVGLARSALAAGLLLAATACAHRPVQAPPAAGAVLEPVSWDEAGIRADDLDFASLDAAVRGSRAYFEKLPPDSVFAFGADHRSAAQMAGDMDAFLAILADAGDRPARAMERIRRDFVLYRSVGKDGRGTVLFTGYYEPLLQGRTRPDAAFRFPLYARPADLLTVDLSQFPLAKSQARIVGRLAGDKVVPYYSREQIDSGKVLAGKGLELLWLDDPVDIFFLQVQGSGQVTLEDGRTVRVQYDASNGQPYRSLGKYLLEKGLIEKGQASLPGIRAYLNAHPADRQALLDQNPSYTFFRLESQGPFGNIGVVLTPGRSIATDARLFPKGALALVRCVKPVLAPSGAIVGWEPFTRFVCNQDTGGAITGPGRVDLFWGSGPAAEAAAGNLQHDGELYFLSRR